MSKIKYLPAVAVLSALMTANFQAVAQDAGDALRYSYVSPMGTARSTGFGSALGSVGGDFTTLSVNPAGIGIYRKSEVMFTPSMKFNSITGDYLNSSYDESSSRFNFNNLGIVFTSAASGKRYDRSDWKSVSFGIGVNRLADFNRNYSYGGLMKGSGKSFSSFSDVFAEDANFDRAGTTDATSTSLGYLGYQSYLVDADSFGFYSVPGLTNNLNQYKTVKERGGINEMVLSLGGNYQEKLMLGATVGIPFLNYIRDYTFEENDASGDPDNDFSNFQYNNSLGTSGVGVNLKLGAIFKPTDAFRLGVALHTPTWYALSDVENRSVTSNTEGFGGISNLTGVEQRFSYNLSTPWRAIISATTLVGKYGFITADYEYVDYSSIRYTFASQYHTDESARNRAIKDKYNGASNIHVGAEGRLDNFAIRAGFGYFGNPYQNKDLGFTRMDFSTGVGFRGKRAFLDIGFTHSVYDSKEQPYLLSDPSVITPVATLQNRLNNIALTVGWKL